MESIRDDIKDVLRQSECELTEEEVTRITDRLTICLVEKGGLGAEQFNAKLVAMVSGLLEGSTELPAVKNAVDQQARRMKAQLVMLGAGLIAFVLVWSVVIKPALGIH